MQKIIEAKHFGLIELLPQEVYQHLEDHNSIWKGWLLFPQTTIITIDSLREEFGPMFINTWGLSESIQTQYGYWNERGYRVLDLYKRPNYVSLHCAGLATDSSFRDITAQEAREFILKNPDKFPYINCLEMTKRGKEIGWLHWDSRPISNRIYELHI